MSHGAVRQATRQGFLRFWAEIGQLAVLFAIEKHVKSTCIQGKKCCAYAMLSIYSWLQVWDV
jgi:hypothetical protein